VSDHVKEALLDSLLMNSYGPDLARRTKLAMAQFQMQQQQDDDNEQDKEEFLSKNAYREREPVECVICFDKMSNCALLPCQHGNCCIDCGKRLKGCHMCRSAIVKVLPLDPTKALSRLYC
jgi:hypothetical protein